MEFLIVDQNENEILSHSGGGKGELFDNRMVFTSNKKFDPIDSAVKELTITPYLLLPTDGGGACLYESGEMIEWEFRGRSLNSVDFKPFKVKLLP
ncbi:DUF5643 domain-containing protein [Alkalihalobacillus sp. 1P02AB]|uniref:DUF5643 domain-containing protein n=1 Tax=Alkalihalobacillus sp. 1P02AB TaxID=3132260 RepID=UPI0039A76217